MGVGLGVGEGRAEVPFEMLAPGVDGVAPDADEDEQPLARSDVVESSARPPRASFRRRQPVRADGVKLLFECWRWAAPRMHSVSDSWLVKQKLLECFRDTVPGTAAIPVRG